LPPGALPEDLVYACVLGVVVQEPGQRAVRLDGGLGRSRARAAATSACFLSSISAIIWASSSASMAQAASCLAVLESDIAAIFSRSLRLVPQSLHKGGVPHFLGGLLGALGARVSIYAFSMALISSSVGLPSVSLRPWMFLNNWSSTMVNALIDHKRVGSVKAHEPGGVC
jgi:hypothetical protein